MPSSSSGNTAQECTLLQYRSSIAEHLKYYDTTTSNLPAAPTSNSNLPLRILKFYAAILDLPAPPTDRHHPNQPFTSQQSSLNFTSLSAVGTVTTTSMQRAPRPLLSSEVYPIQSPEAVLIQDYLHHKRSAPGQVLDNMAAWLNATAQYLQATGRDAEGQCAAELVLEVLDWRDEVTEAGAFAVEEEERRAMESMRGLCLRWGV